MNLSATDTDVYWNRQRGARIKREYAIMLAHPQAVAVTFRPHQRRDWTNTPKDYAHRVFLECDKRRLGKRFYRSPRQFFVGGYLVPEGIDGDLHFHGTITPPATQHPRDPEHFPSFVDDVLQDLWPDGDTHVQLVSDHVGWMQYSTKENSLSLHKGFLAIEFWPDTDSIDKT